MEPIIRAIEALSSDEQLNWRESHGLGDEMPISLDWRTASNWTPNQRKAIAMALHDWVLSQSDACGMLRVIARSSRRISVWLACASARTVLRYVPVGEDRPRIAIETAERWVRGEASERECGVAANNARDAEEVLRGTVGNSSANRAACAAASAAEATLGGTEDAAYAADGAVAAAISAYVAEAIVAANAAYGDAACAARRIALRDICQAIASTTKDAIEIVADGHYRAEA